MITPDFLLEGVAARRLFHEYADSEPILDYHSHLPPKDIAENRRFANLFEIWLEGDHYKWRAMRSNGIAERFCTGDATPHEKFMAFAATVPHTLRNPLYHWTHLELTRYFGITDLLDEQTAQSIWDRANAALAGEDLTVHGILKKFGVRAVCTTDDPTDDLAWHRQIAASGAPFRVFPTFRPDKSMNVMQPVAFNAWADKLAEVSGMSTASLAGFMGALKSRHDFFHDAGCRLSDHGLTACYADQCSESQAAKVFNKARAGHACLAKERDQIASYLMYYFGVWDAERGWTKQLHLGARRNNNTRMFKAIGPDTGFDSMDDVSQVDALCTYLDDLDRANSLPRTIIYNNNPVDNYAIATAIGNFQDGTIPGKIQFGSGWWFLDQKEGMEMQMNALSNCGLLSRFVGMLTDSRSFLSFPRHEYFRRTLCNLVGRDMDRGELPNDYDLVGGMIRRICYSNARDYLRLPGVE